MPREANLQHFLRRTRPGLCRREPQVHHGRHCILLPSPYVCACIALKHQMTWLHTWDVSGLACMLLQCRCMKSTAAIKCTHLKCKTSAQMLQSPVLLRRSLQSVSQRDVMNAYTTAFHA